MISLTYWFWKDVFFSVLPLDNIYKNPKSIVLPIPMGG